ncbi:MAG: hypothetical protein PVG39_22320 [Desulfobacteraceae bacterium]|jgi:hypothetical protein
MNKTKTCILIIAAFAIISLCSGCRHTPKHLTQNFGDSYKAAFNQQVINPYAPEERGAVNSLPGALGNQIYKKRYVKSLTEEKDEEESLSKKLGALN